MIRFKFMSMQYNLHWSWLLMWGCMTYNSPSAIWLYPLFYIFIVLHEFGHIHIAKLHGIDCNSIYITGFGCIADLDLDARKPPNPYKMFEIALAGPAVSLWITAMLVLTYGILIILGTDIEMLMFIAMINFAFMLFNLIPVYPLDGGRIVKSSLEIFLKDLNKANRYSLKTSQFFCLTLIPVSFIIGLYMMGIILGIILFFSTTEEFQNNYV